MNNKSWYDPQQIQVFNSGTSGGKKWKGKLIGLSDYANNPENHPMVIKLETGRGSDWFMGFNRQAGINVDTVEAGDRDTVQGERWRWHELLHQLVEGGDQSRQGREDTQLEGIGPGSDNKGVGNIHLRKPRLR